MVALAFLIVLRVRRSRSRVIVLPLDDGMKYGYSATAHVFVDFTFCLALSPEDHILVSLFWYSFIALQENQFRSNICATPRYLYASSLGMDLITQSSGSVKSSPSDYLIMCAMAHFLRPSFMPIASDTPSTSLTTLSRARRLQRTPSDRP